MPGAGLSCAQRSGTLRRRYYHMKHPWLSRSFLPPSSSPQTERKSKRDVQRAPQKTLEKQNFSLSFTAFSFLLMFNFPSLLSLGVFFFGLGFFFQGTFWCLLQPSSLLSRHIPLFRLLRKASLLQKARRQIPSYGQDPTEGVMRNEHPQKTKSKHDLWETAAYPLPEEILKPTHTNGLLLGGI